MASMDHKRGGTGYASNVSTTLGGARFTTRTGELRAPSQNPAKKYSQSPGGSALNSTFPRYGGGSSARGNVGGNRTSPRNVGRDLANGSKTV